MAAAASGQPAGLITNLLNPDWQQFHRGVYNPHLHCNKSSSLPLLSEETEVDRTRKSVFIALAEFSPLRA